MFVHQGLRRSRSSSLLATAVALLQRTLLRLQLSPVLGRVLGRCGKVCVA